MIDNSIVAGIVTYNPVEERLLNNIQAVISQVKKIIIVDNFSDKRIDLEIKIKLLYGDKIIWIQNEENYGIAQALNSIFNKANMLGSEWVLTLDQDTIVPNHLVETYLKAASDFAVAQIACNIYEENTNKFLYSKKETYSQISRCITSGTMTKVSAWEHVGGYDDYLFIDYVDYDFSLKLYNEGYKIIRCNEIYIRHELGNSMIRKFLFIPVRVANYSTKRKYYIARNIVIYVKRYCGLATGCMEMLRLFRIMCFTVLYEKAKCEKLKAIAVGIKDGITSNENT